MELYPRHQQKQTPPVDSMATGSSTNAASCNTNSTAPTTATITTTTTTNNNNNNNNYNNNSNNSISSSSNSSPPTATTTVTADAATVAIAKDMLQLHHGGAHSNNNNNNNTNNNNTVNSSSEVATMAAASPSPPHITQATTTTAAIATTTTAAAAATVADSSNSVSSPATVTSTTQGSVAQPDNAVGLLKYNEELLYITETCTVIGRNSSTSNVHFHVAENNLVSRKHFQVLYEMDSQEFYVQCLSKNGIFVDDFLQRRNVEPLKLPASCFFRFPSTEIRIQFENFLHASSNSSSAIASHSNHALSMAGHNNNNIHNNNGVSLSHPSGGNAHVIISPAPPQDAQAQSHHHLQQQQQQQHLTGMAGTGPSPLLRMDVSNVIYSPLKISIPKKEQKSPYLSPTGTISAANSCPASPRQGFGQNQSNYNYSNNNLQNQDLFQTPSTASYNHNEKPPYSYAQLIVQAISAAPDKQLTLSGIYSFIVQHYPYYRKETNKGWQNSIRHNLSLNRYFIKVARSQDEPGKGSFWRIDPDSGAKLIDHSYKKRRQRSSQGFRPSYGMPRSAPVSPSRLDNSRENSPLQDIVLQSAPGSPGMSLENRATDGDLMYNAQNMQQTASNNSHTQYSGSPYYITNQGSVAGMAGGQQHPQQPHVDNSGGAGGNGVGALIALKRNHAMAAGAAAGAGGSVVTIGHPQHQQPLHPDIIYEEMATDYSGNMESGDECESAKRPKYISEVL